MAKADKPVEMPKPAVDRYDFTPAQLDVVNGYVTQIQALDRQAAEKKQTLMIFLGYVESEHKLADGKTWTLAFAEDGKPYMQGVTPAKK